MPPACSIETSVKERPAAAASLVQPEQPTTLRKSLQRERFSPKKGVILPSLTPHEN